MSEQRRSDTARPRDESHVAGSIPASASPAQSNRHGSRGSVIGSSGATAAIRSRSGHHRANQSAFGSKRERQVAAKLREQGWVVFHNKASKGVCDLVALRRVTLDHSVTSAARMVEVKGTARSPWVAWGPAEREALREAASRAGATPLLAWWPPHGPLRWIGEAEWP